MIFKLKLSTTDTNSKLLMLLHKETGRSICDIKKACEKSDSIYECNSADTQELTFLNQINEQINDLGFKTQTFIDDKEVNAELFANIEKRNIEIDEEDDM